MLTLLKHAYSNRIKSSKHAKMSTIVTQDTKIGTMPPILTQDTKISIMTLGYLTRQIITQNYGTHINRYFSYCDIRLGQNNSFSYKTVVMVGYQNEIGIWALKSICFLV